MKLTWFDSLESTQAFCIEEIVSSIEAIDGMGVFEVVGCNNQTQGIGTSGRSWVSVPESLCFSICLKSLAVTDIALKISQCVKNVLESKGVKGLRLKWPNDICIEDSNGGGRKKICGVLVNSFASKTSTSKEKTVTYVIGIGLNLAGSLAYSTLSDHGYNLLKDDVLLGILLAVRVSTGLVREGNGLVRESAVTVREGAELVKESILEKKDQIEIFNCLEPNNGYSESNATFACFELGYLLFNGKKQDIIRVGDSLVLSENGRYWTATSREFRYLPESNTLYAIGQEDQLI